MDIIYQNAFYVPSVKKYFCSWSTHDFVGHTFLNGKELFYDGGLSYLRRVGNLGELMLDGSVVDYTLTDKSDKTEIYDKLLILLRPNEYVPIKSLEKAHLEILLSWFEKPNKYRPIVKEVAEYWYKKL